MGEGTAPGAGPSVLFVNLSVPAFIIARNPERSYFRTLSGPAFVTLSVPTFVILSEAKGLAKCDTAPTHHFLHCE